jgi:uncharacterized protein YjiS (DUF1127 family)
MTAIATTQIVQPPVRDGLLAFARQLRATYQRHAQRKAIAGLLDLEPGRLDDLGLSPDDVRAALAGGAPMGSHLHSSRAKRALSTGRKTASADQPVHTPSSPKRRDA